MTDINPLGFPFCCSTGIFLWSTCSYWLLQSHLASNNENASHQKSLSGKHRKICVFEEVFFLNFISVNFFWWETKLLTPPPPCNQSNNCQKYASRETQFLTVLVFKGSTSQVIALFYTLKEIKGQRKKGSGWMTCLMPESLQTTTPC